MPGKAFLDTNVLLYFAAEGEKAEEAEALMAQGGVISVQVLNEMALVCRRKFGLPWDRVERALAFVRTLVDVVPVTVETHELGLRISQRYRLPLYDSMLLSAALLATCEIFWSEDMHDGLIVEGQLTIRNPFVPA
jgi:predicted nucleic acid-binding protein